MKRVFGGCYAPSTLGSFLRAFTFGHVRQLDAVASRFLVNLAQRAPLFGTPTGEGFVFVDVDDTIIEVHGYQKQGSGYGYSGVRGLNALLATASTEDTAPVIIGQRLRKGGTNSARGAKRFVTDALATLKRTGAPGKVLCRFDSAYYGHAAVAAALAGGADVSVTVRMDPAVKDSALAHLPSGNFAANSAWLVAAVMAYNLTRTAGILAAGRFAKARTGTIRRKLINVPARIASSARRVRLRMPESWPWQAGWETLFTATHVPPQAA